MSTQSFIPLTYVVNVSELSPQRGVEPKQVNTLLLLTDEAPQEALGTEYLLTNDAASVTSQYGTNSVVGQVAQSAFAQNPNLNTGSGYLVVANYNNQTTGDPATSGSFTTPDLTENITNFSSVSDGCLNLTVDGQETKISNLEFTGADTINAIANVLQTNLENVSVSIQGNKLIFTSNTTGSTSTVTMSEYGEEEGTDLYGATYLNGAQGTSQAGTNSTIQVIEESTSDAINRLKGLIYTEGIISCRNLTKEEAMAASNTVETTQDQILFLTDINVSTLQSEGLFNSIATNTRTRKLLYLTGASDTQKQLNAKMFAGGYASKLFSTNYQAQNTTLTITYKDLSIVPVDTGINPTILQQAQSVGADVYASIAGVPKIIGCAQAGLYADQLANRTWFLSTLQTTVANVLLQTNSKIPQTEAGMQILKNACASVCRQGVNNGMIAPGEWNVTSPTFGDQQDFLSNIRTFGYYIYTMPIALQSQTEREQRNAVPIQIAVKEAGAIEHADLLVYFQA